MIALENYRLKIKIKTSKNTDKSLRPTNFKKEMILNRQNGNFLLQRFFAEHLEIKSKLINE